jgi:hypothetical protein
LCSPPLSSLCAAAPLSSPPSNSCSHHPTNPSPPSPPLLGAALPLDLRRVGANLQLEFGGRKKERGKGVIQGDFLINSCLFMLQFNQLDVYVCELVEVLSRNFVGGRTTVVLAVSGKFSWLISGNQWENHVELCHTFPMSTYVLDSELYFRRYRCLNPGMLMSKKQIYRWANSSSISSFWGFFVGN